MHISFNLVENTMPKISYLKFIVKYKNHRLEERTKTASGVQCNKLSFADPIEVHWSYYTLAAILFFPSGVSNLYTKMGFI